MLQNNIIVLAHFCVVINDVQTVLTMAWDYHEVWRSIGVELNIDESILDSIEKSHSGHHDCLRALIEVWLAGARLTDAGRETMTKALQSVRVTIAIAGTSEFTYNLLYMIVIHPREGVCSPHLNCRYKEATPYTL